MLTMGQADFLDGVDKFIYHQAPRKEYLSLSGFPGTGKSYIILELYKRYKDKLSMIYAVRVGKAVSRLSVQGVPTRTIHSLFYDVDNSKNELAFKLKPELDKHYDLIIIDEFSTVDKEMWEDILSFHIPVIVVGDADQLPPIGTELPHLRVADYRLDEILRQSADSPIIKLARSIVEGSPFTKGLYKSPDGKSKVLICDAYEIPDSALMKADQIICGTNKHRDELNKKMRRLYKRFDYFPEKGDKLICTQNIWQSNVGGSPIINGTIGEVVRIKPTAAPYLLITFKPEYTDETVTLRVDKSYFTGERYVPTPGVYRFEWGYAITVHKAMGSEWDNVVFFDDKMPKEIVRRFRNTAVTRARRNLIVGL